MFEMFPNEVMFLIYVAFIWIIVAVIMDFRKREVANWWNFSLIIFVLAYRAFVSVEYSQVWYFLWGLIGLLFGFVMANVFYYARMFAGGDAKLMMSLGTILPLSLSWRINLDIALIFLLLFFMGGAIYGAIYSLILMKLHFKEFRKEYIKQYEKYKKTFWVVLICSGILFIISLLFQVYLVTFLSVLIAISPVLLMFAKSLEESCMFRLISVKNLTVGDWVVSNVKFKNKVIKPNWEGISEEDLRYIQKHKRKGKVLVKEGIPFTPAFLIGFALMIYFMYAHLFGY